MRPNTVWTLAAFVVLTRAFSVITTKTQRPSLLNNVPGELDITTLGISSSGIQSDDIERSEDIRPEFAVLFPGDQIEVRVGNLDLARKAWKKRRRSGSPVLVPCSILSSDRKSLVMNNLIFLLRKFGRPMSEQKMDQLPDGFKSHHISLTFPELNRWYKLHLRASLTQHANALGYDTAADLIKDIITPQVEEEFGIKLWTLGNHSWVVAGISRMRGQRLATQSPLLQFIQGDGMIMMHTGKTRIKTSLAPGSYSLEPMSAALRVSQRCIDSGVVATGSIHHGSYMGIDPMGDAGCPLLKVSLNLPTKIQGRRRSRRGVAQMDGKALEFNLRDLKPGQGPFHGTVVHISGRVGAAFVDIGVGRNIKEQRNGDSGVTRVLGMLRFDQLIRDASSNTDAVTDSAPNDFDRVEDAINAMCYDGEKGEEIENDEIIDVDVFSGYNVDDLFDDNDDDTEEGEEIVEDFTLVSLEDGQYTFRNPETGEVIVVGNLGDDDAENGCDDEEDTTFMGMSSSQRLENLDQIMMDSTENVEKDRMPLEVGDSLDVYIQAVSRQSGRFMVTTQAYGPRMKMVKQISKSNKNLDRLLRSFDGDVNNILSLVGEEGDGIVKAASKVGDWVYVQPRFGNLPVGVARCASGMSRESLSEGDSVRVRLDGVDETRGQLAFTVVQKC